MSVGYDIEKERREARLAGQRALQSLRNAQNELNSARNWGVVDILGGGLLSTFIKHNKMDNAKQYMTQASNDLRIFCRELGDVQFPQDMQIETNDFLSFADYFWDGFLADVMMQSRINTAQQKVSQAISRVESILRQL